MEDHGVQVGTVRPHDGAQLLVDLNASEQVWIPQEGFKDRAPEQLLNVDVTTGAVIERQPEPEAF